MSPLSPSTSRAPRRATAGRRRGRPVDRGLPQRRRAEILAAAAGFFARHGYADADLALLAAEVGVGKGTLYRYFPSKEQLFRSALLRGLAALHAEVAAASAAADAASPDGLGALRGGITAYLAYFDRHPELIELMVLERAALKGRGKPTYFAHRDRYLGPWRARLRGLVRAGRVRPMDVATITSCLGMLMYGALVTHPFMAGRRGLAALAPGVLDLVMHGIAVAPARAERGS
jgi:AcrR family transcriptional regulator